MSALLAGVNFSGCQPRRYSSPTVAFCVQMSRSALIWNRETQMLQPMHSRISSKRPSSIFVGQERVGDRRARRADDVEQPGADRFDHHVGVREPADADDRLLGVRADLLDPWLLVVLLDRRARTRADSVVSSSDGGPT